MNRHDRNHACFKRIFQPGVSPRRFFRPQHAPCGGQPFERPRGVCGTGRGQRRDRPSVQRFLVPVVVFCGGASVGEDGFDRARVKNTCKVGGLYVADGRVGRADDVAFRDRIPQRDAVSQQHRRFFVDRIGRRLLEHGCEHAPEAVLRVTVVETVFAREHGRQAPQHEDAAAAVKDRRKWMHNVD